MESAQIAFRNSDFSVFIRPHGDDPGARRGGRRQCRKGHGKLAFDLEEDEILALRTSDDALDFNLFSFGVDGLGIDRAADKMIVRGQDVFPDRKRRAGRDFLLVFPVDDKLHDAGA